MFKDLPFWLAAINTVALVIGYIALAWIALFCMRPLARGLSHGLYETVLYWKAGVPALRVLKRGVRALYFDFPLWGFLNSTTTSTSIGPASWGGVFRWHFRDGFTRSNSIREAAAERAAARKKAMDDDV